MGERAKREKGLEQLLEHYDKEMLESTTKLKELDAEIKNFQEEMSKVESDLHELEEAREAYEAEERLRSECDAHITEIKRTRNAMAMIIQAFYRAHARRAEIANRGKKGKKGKKK